MNTVPAVIVLVIVAGLAGAVPKAAAQDPEPPMYTVSGVVVSDAGEPLANVNVNAHTSPEGDGDRRISSGGHAQVRTGEDGAFELRLPEGRGHISVYYEAWRQGDGRELVLTENVTDLRFELRTPPPKTAVVEGRVVDAEGRPVEGAQVSLQHGCCYAYEEPMPLVEPAASEEPASAEGNTSEGQAAPAKPTASSLVHPCCYDDYATTLTDADGRFRFESYGGPRQVTAYAKGFAQTTRQVEAVPNETVEVGVVLEKVPASDAVVAGRVLDAATGLPLANAHVSARSLEWGRHAWAQTDADGRFRLTIVPGWTEIGVSHYDHPRAMPLLAGGDEAALPAEAPRQYFPDNRLVELASGENPLEVSLAPKPQPTVALVGYVVDPTTDEAVAGAHVNVWNMETGDWGSAVTDATGSYRILVRPGHHQANAHKEGYLGGSQTFSVPDEPTHRRDILMPEGTPKWAPCWDEECGGGYVAYDEGRAAPMPMAATPTMAPTSPAPSGAQAQQEDAAGGPEPALAKGAPAAGGEGMRASSYVGAGGGLPPYDPAQAPGAQTSGAEGGLRNEVPAPALLATLALAGVAALAWRRR